MKETPIIMSGDHPKKILDGIKTMTRRTWGLKAINTLPDNWIKAEYQGDAIWHFISDGLPAVIKCPYGQVGDRLWVKETWGAKGYGQSLPIEKEPMKHRLVFGKDTDWQCRRPSIHMPRWASRITLEITGLRVERVQRITAGDCTKEGIPYENGDYVTMKVFDKFRQLWDSLNAKRGYSWESNPWVLVIEFNVVGLDG